MLKPGASEYICKRLEPYVSASSLSDLIKYYLFLMLLTDYQIVLASKSPRRQQLLSGMDIHFAVQTKETEESFPANMPLQDVAPFLSEKKAMAFEIAELPANFLLITADTVVIVDDQILNKPADKAEAVFMLQKLSGKTHQVVTGVCLRSASKTKTFSESSDVTFGALTLKEIQWYVDHYQPFDKAGAYGIQEWIGYIAIKHVSGSFYNVMGLPTHRLFEELKIF